MESKIRQLSTETINQIAAGEVIERPASVVKELVENSIDAKSTQITITISNYGKDLIEVRDNGTGMSETDISYCIKRHATSKIYDFKDIFSINSLGFRGEAIASIASISDMEISSKPHNMIEGVATKIQNEKIVKKNPVGMAGGTKISVKNLFFNTPVRKKFLKNDKTELMAISDTINKIAIPNSEIEFTLIHNDKTLFSYKKNPLLKNRILDVFGREFVKNSSEIIFEEEELFIHGFIASPSINKSNASSIYIFVNGRYIRDKSINHAIISSYNTFLMHGRYPMVVMILSIDPSLIDINVHPTKSEIKFTNPRKIYDLTHAVIRQRLSSTFWLEKTFVVSEQNQTINNQNQLRDGIIKSFENFSSTFSQKNDSYNYHKSTNTRVIEPQFKMTPDKSFYSSLQPIGQFRAQYIICENENKLYLIDHHAAHERIIFEKIKKEYELKKIETQNLLIPHVFEISSAKGEILQKHSQALLKTGIEIEYFGDNTFVVKGIPSIIPEKFSSNFINDLVENILEKDYFGADSNIAFTSTTPFLNKIFSSLACHSALRGEKRLSVLEIEDLLRQLDQYQINSNCPHGRPIIIEFSLEEIEKKFGRIL